MDSSKPGLFYSPPRPNYQPPGGGGGGGGGRGRANTSGSDSSTTDLIIPEESSDMCIQKQSEGKYSSRDGRHGVRHKHRRHERQWKHGSLSSMFVCLFVFSCRCVWVCSETVPSGKLCQLIHNYVKGFISFSLYLAQIQNTLGYKRDLCHLIMKQNLCWREEIVREFFIDFCFGKSSQSLHMYWF